MIAASESGTARNTHSSMKPACSAIEIGVNAGTTDDRMLGSVKASDGCHQPNHWFVTK